MTLRTFDYYVCPAGHRGVKKTSENDQPYSKCWESVSLTGMREIGTNERGMPVYVCSECGQQMT